MSAAVLALEAAAKCLRTCRARVVYTAWASHLSNDWRAVALLALRNNGRCQAVTEPMPDDGFATFLADARSLDPTINADAACHAWTTLQNVQTFWQLRKADLSDYEWHIMLLATRGFFKRLGPAPTPVGTT